MALTTQTFTDLPDTAMCSDCILYYVNGDLSPVDYFYNGIAAEDRARAIVKGVARELHDCIIGDPSGEGYLGTCDCCGITASVTDYETNSLG